MIRASGAAEERSTAIVLFTDLVGSTELRSRLGEDAAEEVRRKHDRLVGVAVEANRGRLVKHLGDGVMATFTGASDAVAAAVDIQQGLDRFSRSDQSAATLEMRVGLSAGDVVVEEGDCFGTPVIEAARLCAAARGGQVLATEVVRLLAGSAGGHRFTPVGTLELKGLPGPVPAYEVSWEPLPAAPLAFPSLLGGVGRIFVGREPELERLTQLWKEAAGGERRVALLAGEPGIGKTRLASELARTAHDDNGVVLAGRCDEDLGVPYQPFVEALRHYATGTSDPRLGRYGGELTRLVPELGVALPGLPEPLRSDPETERYRLFDAVASWLADLSAETPAVLVLDDLHWAARPTLLLLRHVMRFAEPLRLFVVVTYRDSEVGRGHPLSELLADLRRQGGVERLSLTGLDRAAVSAYMEAAAGHTLSDDDDDDEEERLSHAVWEETEGNAFFVVEVFRHLAESGAIAQRDGRWTTTAPVEELGIPEGVRDVVGRRLTRLSESANRALGVASVIGLEFEPAVLRAAGGLDEDALLSALDEAVTARLLTELPGTAPRYRFGHTLVRATLYDELTAARRVTFHRRVAEAIESLYGEDLEDHLPALSHHWARAAAPAAETTRAVHYARRAGDRALAQLAFDEAADYYGQALELQAVGAGQVDEHLRLELLIGLGSARKRAADPAAGETLLKAAGLAQTLGDTDGLARAALANTRAAYWSSAGRVDEQSVTTLEAAIAAIGEAETPTRARLLASLAVELVYIPGRARRVGMSDEALRIARVSGDPATLAHVLASRFFTIFSPATVTERLADTSELLSLVGPLNDPLMTWVAHWTRHRVLLEDGDVEEADLHFDQAEKLAAELGQPTLRWMVLWSGVARLLRQGRLDLADRRADEAFEVGQASGQPDAGVFYGAQRFAIRYEQARLAELEPTVAELRREFPAVPGFALFLALVYCEDDRHDEVQPIWESLVEASFPLPEDPTWLLFHQIAAEVAWHLQDDSAAALLYDRLLPFATLYSVAAGIPFGCTEHYLGMLAATMGRFEPAECHFTAAAATYERIVAPAWLARTRLEWARMLLARREPGDEEHARGLVGQSVATARELGLWNVERRAVALLS